MLKSKLARLCVVFAALVLTAILGAGIDTYTTAQHAHADGVTELYVRVTETANTYSCAQINQGTVLDPNNGDATTIQTINGQPVLVGSDGPIKVVAGQSYYIAFTTGLGGAPTDPYHCGGTFDNYYSGTASGGTGTLTDYWSITV